MKNLIYFRPPFNFVEDSGSRTSEADKTTEAGKQQQQQHQPPLFTLEHPFANQAFYDDDDYLENGSKEDEKQQQQQQSGDTINTVVLNHRDLKTI